MFDSQQPDLLKEHLADIDIVRESDGELSVRRARQVRRHIASCWSCRARKAELDQSVSDFIHFYREQFDRPVPPGELSRKLLQAHLDESSLTMEPSPWWTRVVSNKVAYLCAAAVMVIALALTRGYPFLSIRNRSAADASYVLPNPTLSPGSASLITNQQVCRMQSIEDDRLNDALARKIFERYRIAQPVAGRFEIDYVVPPALGGQQSAENLWPQPYQQGTWNSHTKDALEKRLEALVCSNQIDLRQAQSALSTDWIDAYKSYFHSSRPLLDHAAFIKDRAWPFSTQKFR